MNVYPTGQVSLGTGNLQEATVSSFKTANGGTLMHTLAKSPSGVAFGNKDCSGTIDFIVPQTGPEHDVISDIQAGTHRSFRFKAATATWSIKGVFVDATVNFADRGAVKVTASFVGELSKSPV